MPGESRSDLGRAGSAKRRYGWQFQCDQGLVLDPDSQAATAMLASPSNTSAPDHPALTLELAQVPGRNWNNPDAPDASL